MKHAFFRSLVERLLAYLVSKHVNNCNLTVKPEDGGSVTVRTTYPFVVKDLSMEQERKILISVEKETNDEC